MLAETGGCQASEVFDQLCSRGAFRAIDYSVIYGSTLIGTLPALFLPQLNDHFLLAARRWQVLSVDDDRKEVIV